MTAENKDPIIPIVKEAFEETHVKQVTTTMDTKEVKRTKSNDSSLNSLSSYEYRPPSSLNALSRRPSSLNLGKSSACNAVLDVTSSPVLSEKSLPSMNHQSATIPSYSIDNALLIIIMSNSIIDKDVTIQNIEKQDYKIIDQHFLQLSPSQVDILYAYEESTTKLHYKQLFDNWKQISLR
ncbi:hypothetical protein BJ944DRAFT_77608 [Cunninghamella echinulata]|nr:hypothetical protein BJ944DRAFT_77608 [Cunninghamella echinulata]